MLLPFPCSRKTQPPLRRRRRRLLVPGQLWSTYRFSHSSQAKLNSLAICCASTRFRRTWYLVQQTPQRKHGTDTLVLLPHAVAREALKPLVLFTLPITLLHRIGKLSHFEVSSSYPLLNTTGHLLRPLTSLFVAIRDDSFLIRLKSLFLPQNLQIPNSL